MGLFIGQTDGTNNFDVGQVELDIAQMGLQDGGVGFTENPTTNIEGVTCVQVTYGQTISGNTSDRLRDLVNNVTYTSPPDVIIFAVDDSFVLDDGTTSLPLQGNGVALEAGASFSPFANNVCAFYDKTLCGGLGVWVDREGGGTVCNTTETVLYHELSHCFHYVTGTTASTSAQEEINAEIDENDMRDVLGLDHRDVDSHNGGCGSADSCGTCCIIATLATGSAYSDPVRRFRQFREKILRRTEVGDAFFKEFHYHYYTFSPEVCRLMGHQPNLSPEIREKFVVPLLAAIELLIFYAESKGNGLADFLQQQSEQAELQCLYRTEFLEELSSFLGLVKNLNQTPIMNFRSLQNEKLTGFSDLLTYINEQTLANEYVKWALVDVLEIWVTSAMLLKSDKSRKEIESEIYRLISDWIAYLPVAPVWEDLSRLQAELELESLGQFIFDLKAKRVFAGRLIKIYPKYSTTIHRWSEN